MIQGQVFPLYDWLHKTAAQFSHQNDVMRDKPTECLVQEVQSSRASPVDSYLLPPDATVGCMLSGGQGNGDASQPEQNTWIECFYE